MNILTLGEGLQQNRIFGEMREDSKLDLRIIRSEQQVVFFRNERAADLASIFRFDGYVLQIRIGTGKPARLRNRLVKRSVDAIGDRIGERQ